MARTIDLHPVSRITANAMGEPGNRTFYIQARKGATMVTLLCEKEQVRALAVALEQMLDDLKQKHPRGASYMRQVMDMSLEEPVSPDFRVGTLGLGYDEADDLIVLVARELQPEEAESEDALTVRFFCSRQQMDALALHAHEVVSKGRPICALCGKPMDFDGNVQGFCPRRNGHADEIVFA
jgi:uncharacterized repeat protein (TIGR03847 family)